MKLCKQAKSKLALGLAAAGMLTAPAYASDSMAAGENGWSVSEPLFTVGESIGSYTPPGILDGLGAIKLNRNTVRVFSNHELLHFRGYPYELSDGQGGTYTATGARVSYFDIDRHSRQVVGSGLAYDRIYDPNGNLATDTGVFTGLSGYSRFCSSVLVKRHEFGRRRGLEDDIYFTGEEDGGFFNPIGGYMWALDVDKGEMWAVPAMGRGAWENVTAVDTGSRNKVAFILADDSSPFDHDGDGADEAVPIYLYVGVKQKNSHDFLERNGLRDGKLYVFVADDGRTLPSEFNTSGTLDGTWVEVDNTPQPALAQDTSDRSQPIDRLGYDAFGYPTQGNLIAQAEALGAFGFSRPEDVSYNPGRKNSVVLASTGVDTYDIGSDGNGADTFGTLYVITTNFHDLSVEASILYDGDADPSRALRSPDNLDWGDGLRILVQEDEAEEDTASGDEVLFGDGAANPNEAGIVAVDPLTGAALRVANIDRSVVLDGSLANPSDATDVDAGDAGEWESSGILDVSKLFGEPGGTLFIFNVQAHGIEDQDQVNPASRINDSDLVEGGQLLFLEAPEDYGRNRLPRIFEWFLPWVTLY